MRRLIIVAIGVVTLFAIVLEMYWSLGHAIPLGLKRVEGGRFETYLAFHAYLTGGVLAVGMTHLTFVIAVIFFGDPPGGGRRRRRIPMERQYGNEARTIKAMATPATQPA